MSENNPQTNSADAEPKSWRQRLAETEPALIIVAVLALLGLIAMIVTAVLLLRSSSSDDGSATDGDQPIAEATSTADGQDLSSSNNLPIDQEIIVVYDGAQSLSIDLDPPTTLGIGSSSFPVRVQFVDQEGGWQPQSSSGNAAEWVYGSIVNYVFGLEGSDENRQILEQLFPGDRLTIRTRNGDVLSFAVIGRELTTASNAELFVQNRPELTVVWLGDAGNDQRLVLRADYVLPEEQTADSAPASVEPGQPAQMGELRFTVNNTSQVVDSAGTPPGFSLFLIDYVIENIGSTPLDTGLLRFVLVDDLGNQYSLNSLASQAGSFPLLSGFVDTGVPRQVTAGYQIPNNLSGESLRWVVSRVDNPSQIEVEIPFGGRSLDNAVVNLQGADVSPDGTSLVLSGQITNLGAQPMIVTEQDITLTGGGTVYLVFSTNPGFPWTVGPGQTIPFLLNFQRPVNPDAVFSIGQQSFQLTNLR